MSGSKPNPSQVSNNKVHSTELPTTLETKTKPKDLSVLAFIVTVLFNHICGFFAYHFVVSAKHSWQLHDYKKAGPHSKYSVALITLGIILGLATYALAFSLFFTLHGDKACRVGQSHDKNSGINNNNGQTKCCQYSPIINEVPRALGDIGIEIYCSTPGNGPIYPDQNGTYSECCFELGCYQDF